MESRIFNVVDVTTSCRFEPGAGEATSSDAFDNGVSIPEPWQMYPICASLGFDVHHVAVVGTLGSLAIGRSYRVAPLAKLTSHVSLDILLFLWGMPPPTLALHRLRLRR